MLLVLGSLAMGFLVLTVFVLLFPSSFIDREFSEEVQEHSNPFLDTVMKGVSIFGYMPYSAIIVLGTGLLFLLFKHKKEALFVVLTALSSLVSLGIKILVNRPRPTDNIVRILVKTTEKSFPSGHVLFYVVFFGFLTLLMYEIKSIPKLVRYPVSAVSLLMIFTVPYSRVYLGAHWFTDVIAGFFLGLICLYGLSVWYLKKPVQ
ncbi:phosphatase PAP2 family protein [Mucilaginibacter sp. UYCu711]|uniref:phosphatase PAP2 family protein n=1 Tax=Mucilaginibacter sp. UYCu711 TaxID=3156339 RepID=UPI003D1C41B4